MAVSLDSHEARVVAWQALTVDSDVTIKRMKRKHQLRESDSDMTAILHPAASSLSDEPLDARSVQCRNALSGHVAAKTRVALNDSRINARNAGRRHG
jgi:hypothetical protein